MSRLVGLLIVMVALLAPLASAVLSTGTAQAKDVECDFDGSCKVYCTQNLPNGNRVQYEEGTNVTVTTPDGVQHKFTCKNGEWVSAAIIHLPGWGKIKSLGNIGVGGIAGVKGELTTEVCNDSPEPICTIVDSHVGPPGLAGIAAP